MHCDIINVGADGIRNVCCRALGIGRLTEVLLLVQNVMLGASNNSGILDSLHSLCNGNTGQYWIWTEAWTGFRISSFLW